MIRTTLVPSLTLICACETGNADGERSDHPLLDMFADVGGPDRYPQGGWPIDDGCWHLDPTGSEPGDVAEDFALVDQFGQTVHLHDFCEHTVLLVSAAYW
jgi:hypothetical protein